MITDFPPQSQTHAKIKPNANSYPFTRRYSYPKITRPSQPPSLQYPLVASLAFLSNGILDKLGKATYHPPKPLWKDKFWLAYHSFMALLTAYTLLRFWTKYQVGMIFSILPDLEWLVVHLWKQKPILHPFFSRFFNQTPLLNYLKSLPNWRLKRKGIIPELILLAILAIIINS